VAALKPLARPDEAELEAAAAVRRCVAPGATIAVLPCSPRLYLEARREPGVPNVFYFPWQEEWAPQREATAAALRAGGPAAVVTRPETLWGRSWPAYAPAVSGALEAAYRPAAAFGTEGLLVWARTGDAAVAACLVRRAP
jgi:hypothetical protein